MNITTISIRNIRRKPSRTILLLLVFTLGVSSIVSLYQISLVVGHSLEKKLTTFGANIIIAPKTETLTISYGGFNLGEMFFDIPQLQESNTITAIKSIELQDRISIVAPKLISPTKVNGSTIAVIGVRWQQEQALKSYWAFDGVLPTDGNQVVLGEKLAETLSLSKGDTITLFGEDFVISGVLFETGSDDDTALFMELSTLQKLTNVPNIISFIEVAAICSGCPIGDIVDQLSGALPSADVKALQNVVNQRMASITFVQNLALLVSIIILITAASMVSLSMFSAVNERRKDIGILRSLGFAKSKIFFIFCFEAALIGILAGFIGYLAGFFASFKILKILTLADGVQPVFDFSHLLLTCLIFGLITLVSVIYPAWKGATVEPSSALTAL